MNIMYTPGAGSCCLYKNIKNLRTKDNWTEKPSFTNDVYCICDVYWHCKGYFLEQKKAFDTWNEYYVHPWCWELLLWTTDSLRTLIEDSFLKLGKLNFYVASLRLQTGNLHYCYLYHFFIIQFSVLVYKYRFNIHTSLYFSAVLQTVIFKMLY